jgi:hypothetical protein
VDLANLTRCKQATLEWAQRQRVAKEPQFVSGLAFEIIQELFMASLVQRFKSLGGT